MESVVSVILGGGQGSRLYPLTKTRSKPAVPIGGKYRLVDIPISNCLNSDIRRIFVLTQFNSASLNRHIKNTYHFDLFSRGFVDILAAEQTHTSYRWFQGTADAVRQSFHHLENQDYDYVLILSGDQLYQMDFRDMIRQHADSGADLTIATIPVNKYDATGFGIMKMNEDKQISSFVEKPDLDNVEEWKSEVPQQLKNEGREYMASMGIYIFSRKALYELFENNPDAKDFGKEIIPTALGSKYSIYSFLYNGYWTDIGTVKSFFEANLELTNTLPRFNLYDNNRMIYTHARLLPASKLMGTTLEKAIISEGCIIEASRIEHTLVGIRARIGKGTTISNAIVMGNDYFPKFDNGDAEDEHPDVGIGERCYINNAIIDKNVSIGNDVRINGGDHLENGDYGEYSVVDGIVVVPRGNVLKEGTVI
ncbi:MAG TPA: glucose-1-phosphate adenylyltransferase [Balneolales bacterium]|nr:glucose-1-phosphate adenylyltransferase [Balneolales bacterium]